MNIAILTYDGFTALDDMALSLVAKIAGVHVAQAIQLGIEYDPHPPFDAGSPTKAPSYIVDGLRAKNPQILNI